MGFVFVCPHCGNALQAREEWDNLETTCPHCGSPVRIVGPERSISGSDGAGGALPASRVRGNGGGRLISRPGLNVLFGCWAGSAAIAGCMLAAEGDTLAELLRSRPLSWLIPPDLGGGFWGGLLFMLVFGWCLLYRYWQLIPPERAATTPGTAVGLLFVPLFNFYWVFVAYWKLGCAFERETGGGNRLLPPVAFVYCLTLAAGAAERLLVGSRFIQAAGYLWYVVLFLMYQHAASSLMRQYERNGVVERS